MKRVMSKGLKEFLPGEYDKKAKVKLMAVRVPETLLDDVKGIMRKNHEKFQWTFSDIVRAGLEKFVHDFSQERVTK